MSLSRQFLLLLWKNYTLQVRRKVGTFFELFLPLFFTAILVALRVSVIKDERRAEIKYSPFDIASLPYNVTHQGTPLPVPVEVVLAYAPNTSVTLTLMQNVGNILGVKQFLAFKNEKDMVTQLVQMQDSQNKTKVLGGVVISKLPDGKDQDAEYKVRFGSPSVGEAFGPGGINTDRWLTEFTFPPFQLPEPRRKSSKYGGKPDYYSTGFLSVQQAVAQAIIEWKGNISVNHKMNRMPYPSYIHDPFILVIQNSFPLLLMLSFVYTALNIVKNVVREKEKKLKESMKMMGLSNWLHWTAWFIQYLLFLLISTIFVTILLTIKFNTHGRVISRSDPFLVFIFLLLYMISSIMFCFCVSVFFKKANTAAAAGGILWFLSYAPFSFIQQSYDTMSLSSKLGGCIVSNVAMGLGSQLIGKWEGQGSGIQWSNLHHQVTSEDTLTMGHVLLMFIADSVLYGLIVWYVEAVFPGEYGLPQPWYFPVLKSYWCGTPPMDDNNRPEYRRQISSQNPEYFEKEPINVIPGVQIRKLEKTFNTETGIKTAVNGVSLNMYEGQITALLGHNGAGKTTLMSMLTGLFPPSSGGAVINGYDILSDMTGVRKSLGLCPQHNILFDTLTVEEHLWFFAMLKGRSSKKASEELDEMLESLAMVDKKTTQSKSLSGGMKRKLSVGIALIGDSKIVMLDEPTSGMDPSARRFTWDLLKNYRTDRTILLTTHFMDEADYLGDRIAIMAEGEIQCCGTSLFLKNKYGIGYHMVIVKDAKCNVKKVMDVIKKHVPSATLENNIGAELSFILPREESAKFEGMFTELESRRQDLGINSYGASVTTMEEVFLKVGELVDDTLAAKLTQNLNDDDRVNADTEELVPPSPMTNFGSVTDLMLDKSPNTGFRLFAQRWWAMFVKRFLHSRRHKAAIASQLLLPLIFTMIALIVALTFPQPGDSPLLKLDLSGFGDNVVTYGINGSIGSSASNISRFYKEQFDHSDTKIDTLTEETMTQYLLQVGSRDIPNYNKQYMIGATFQQTDNRTVNVTSWFNNQAYHTPAITLAAVQNAVYKHVTNGGSLRAVNHPLPRTAKEAASDLLSRNGVGFNAAFNLLFGMAFLASSFVVFLVQERSNKAKHVQFVSGVDPISYWTSAYLWDLINFSIPCYLILILFAAFNVPAFTGERLGYIFLLLMLYGWAIIPLMYIASFIFRVASTAFVRLTMFNVITGLSMLLTVFILSIPALDTMDVADALKWAFLVLPNYCLGQALIDLFNNYNALQIYDQFIQACLDINKEFPFIHVTKAMCEKKFKEMAGSEFAYQTNYLAWANPGIGRFLIFLSWLGPVFFLLVLLIEYRLPQTLIYKVFGKRSDLPRGVADMTQHVAREDEDVYLEKMRIQRGQSQMDCLTLQGFTKIFRSLGKPALIAVDHLYLGIPLGECFGLLGVNGAGKTTTFRMLTGDETPTSGTAILDGLDIQTHMQQARQKIGYCPQFDAIIELLTGREILTMFARLRGVPESDIAFTVDNLIKALLLHDHADNIAKTYSGGNKRKLSTAMALVGDPPIVFLDEPSTGMDPVARRLLWDSLCRFRAEGRCIVITSHSMEECEALCTRLAIMVNGQFKCLGSPQHLKGKFGEGYTIMARVAGHPSGLYPPNTAPLKQMIEETFTDSILKDEHEGLVHYHIRDTSKSWAYVFGMMERAKVNYNIEDYSVSQTTLEQVFLNFARAQRVTEDD